MMVGKLNIVVKTKCFKSEPFLLNSFKLTFQSNDNARNLGQRHFLLICWGHEQKKVENPWVNITAMLAHLFVRHYLQGVGTGKFLGLRRIFARISPNLPEKFLCDFCLQSFSHKDQEDLFLV